MITEWQAAHYRIVLEAIIEQEFSCRTYSFLTPFV
jgi:hypothetical protein